MLRDSRFFYTLLFESAGNSVPAEIFVSVADASGVGDGFADVGGIIRAVLAKDPFLTEPVLLECMNALVRCGLCEYEKPLADGAGELLQNGDDASDALRETYARTFAYPRAGAGIRLTAAVSPCSGRDLCELARSKKRVSRLPAGASDAGAATGSELEGLRTQLDAMKKTAAELSGKLDGMLLRQIEILTVFVLVISMIITNIIGIDAFGNIGIRGLIRIDACFVLSGLILILGVKAIILGFNKR